MNRWLLLNALGALLLLAAWGAGLLFLPFRADTSGISFLILVLFAVGLWRAALGLWDDVQWISRRLVRLGLLGTLVGFAVALAGLTPDSFGDIANVKRAAESLLQGAGVAVYTSIVGWIGALWLDLNRRLLTGPSTTRTRRR